MGDKLGTTLGPVPQIERHKSLRLYRHDNWLQKKRPSDY